MPLYNEIEKLEYGESANDGKGYDLRTAEMITDSNIRNIVLFLTGGTRETGRLDNINLPIVKGGTGAGNLGDALKNFEIVAGPNGELVKGQGSVAIYNDKFEVFGKSSNKFAFSRIALGHYRLEGAIKWGTGYRVLHPKDVFSNIICGAEILPIASGVDIKTYKVHAVPGESSQAGVEFSWALNTAKPIDIPVDRFILFNLITA